MEIERKFTLKSLPDNLERYPRLRIEQAYLSTNPVVRVRRENDEYYMTYKGSGMMAREEHNLWLSEEAYYHLREKADGRILSKTRYLIPWNVPASSPVSPRRRRTIASPSNWMYLRESWPPWFWPRWNLAAPKLLRLSCPRTGSTRT